MIGFFTGESVHGNVSDQISVMLLAIYSYIPHARTGNLISNNRLVIRRVVYQSLSHHINPIVDIEIRLPIPIVLHILLDGSNRGIQHPPRELMVVGIDSLERNAVNTHPVEVASRQDIVPMLGDRIGYELGACVEDVDDGHRIGDGAGIHDNEGLAAANAPEHAGVVAAGAER